MNLYSFGRLFIQRLLIVCIILCGLDILFPVHISIPYSRKVEARDSSLLRAYLSEDQKWRLHVTLQDVPPQLIQSLLYKEDRFFYYHFGVNPVSVIRAIAQNVTTGKRTSGASTITMQVVRLLHPRKRTYWNKCIEIMEALRMEWHFNKDEILEMYMNLLPYGGNIEGIQSASWLYFQKPLRQLSLAQLLTLTVIPNKPTSLRLGKNTHAILKARNRWLKIMREEQIFSKNAVTIALNEPFDAYRIRLPTLAPHLSQRVIKQHGEIVIQTTINPILQSRSEQTLKNYLTSLQTLGISNASAIIIDNKTREVLAYVGSMDFWDTTTLGQNDGVKAVRSPGSALKPFVYALAYEQGWLTPRKMVLDVPTDIQGFIPENYDRQFNGKTTAGNALAQSLNIPAIRLLNEIGVDKFCNHLVTGGISTFENQKLGLSMVLGGCGVRLDELTNLYVSLASEGKFVPLKWLKNDPIGTPKAWFSPESAFLVTQSLSQLQRPDFPTSGDYATNFSKIAWKTGTSQGKRDAWAIGYRPDYTIGVWVGNFNGASNPHLSGSETAVPLLFQLFSLMGSCKNWFGVTKGIGQRTVCSESGLLPEEFCENTVSDYYITKNSDRERCQHMKWIWVSEDHKKSYCVHCLPINGVVQRLYPNIPLELVSYYEDQKIHFERIPAHASNCNIQKSGHPFRIISPVNGTIYYLKNTNRLRLRAESNNNQGKIFWFINKKFFRSAQTNEEIFFEAIKGELYITCIDDQGRRAECSITVK